MSISFAGKKALVTGGANGLGKAVVKELHDNGAIVFVVDKDTSSIADLKKEFPNVIAESVDLRDFEAARKVVESFGPLDHLVNNAGIWEAQSFLDIDMKTMDRTFDVNFKSYVVVSQVVARGMIANKIEGSIVNVSSVASRQATAKRTSYCCTKAAVEMLTKNMALELGVHNIRVNCISPALADTKILTRSSALTEDLQKLIADKALNRNIIKRLIEPKEVADLVLFLLGSTSSMITGQNVFIDGGYSIS